MQRKQLNLDVLTRSDIIEENFALIRSKVAKLEEDLYLSLILMPW